MDGENIGEFGKFVANRQIIAFQNILVDKIHKSKIFVLFDYNHVQNTEVFSSCE